MTTTPRTYEIAQVLLSLVRDQSEVPVVRVTAAAMLVRLAAERAVLAGP